MRLSIARRAWTAVASATAALALAVTPVSAAFVQNTYSSTFNISQETDCWCAVATTKIMVRGATPTFSTSQTTINAYMATKDKYPGMWNGCGHDPRGIAWGVYNYTPAGYTFNDYRYSTQSTADWEIVYGIRATADPVIVSVAAGLHSVAIVGYSTTIDPFLDGTNAINGFYVVDPWYPHNYSAGLGSQYNPAAPPYGLPHTSSTAWYLTRSSWDSQFLLRNTSDGAFWNTYYVPVLRTASTSATPSDTPGQTYGDWYYQTHYGPVPAPQEPTAPTASTSIEAAVSAGISQNGLENHYNLRGYHLGAVAHVDSLAKEMPSYDLVEIRMAEGVRALAMVNETTAGYVFAALAPSSAQLDIATSTGRAKVLARKGLTGPGRLVWGWVIGVPATPFDPLVEGKDLTTGAKGYVGISGRLEGIALPRGLALIAP